MLYTPPFSIRIEVDLRTYESWKRQAIALLMHELAHMYQYFVLCHCATASWISLEDAEALPLRVQGLVLRLLGCSYLSA